MRFSALNVLIFALVYNIFLNDKLTGQDIHFSQFHTTNLLNNPASIGVMEPDFRVTNNYRNQWASIDLPFNTYHISIDQKLNIGDRQFGIGAFIVNDQSFGNRLSVNKFFLSVCYSMFIDNHQIVFGLQPGMVLKNINSQGLTFGSQFDPVSEGFNTQLPDNENNLVDNASYFDVNAGVVWRTYYKGLMPMVGIAVNHLARPVESFVNGGNHDVLPLKFVVTAQTLIPLTARYDITPCFLLGTTRGAKEFVAGAIGGYNLLQPKLNVQRIYAISYFRVNPVRNFDAIIIGGGLTFFKFDLGISYDINVSSLHKATNFKGAFEISLVFTGGKRKIGGAEPCNAY